MKNLVVEQRFPGETPNRTFTVRSLRSAKRGPVSACVRNRRDKRLYQGVRASCFEFGINFCAIKAA